MLQLINLMEPFPKTIHPVVKVVFDSLFENQCCVFYVVDKLVYSPLPDPAVHKLVAEKLTQYWLELLSGFG